MSRPFVRDRAMAFDVGDIEGLVIGAAGKAELHAMAHRAMGAIAAGEVGDADESRLISLRNSGGDAVAMILEIDELGLALDA